MKLAVLEISRFDDETLRPWSVDADCVTVSVHAPKHCDWPRPPVPMTAYETVADRHFAFYEPLFTAGTNDEGPRLPGAEVGFMAAADFALFIETRYAMVLLLDMIRVCGQYPIDRVEFVTDRADGGRYHDVVRALAAWRHLPYRHVRAGASRPGMAQVVARGLRVAAGRLSVHGPSYVDYLRARLLRRMSTARSPRTAPPPAADKRGRPDAVRAAMLVYHPKSWQYLLPIRESLLAAGHEVLLISPRLASDEVLDRAGVDYVSIRDELPNWRLRRRVADYLAGMDWRSTDDDLAPLVAAGGPLRRLVILSGLAACDIYADLAVRLANLLRRNRVNVVLGTDAGSVAGRCFFKTAERMDLETVFVQHGSVFTLVGTRQYMLRSHRLLWGSTSSDRLAECGVERADRNVVFGSPFHEKRYGHKESPGARADTGRLVLVTFGVPGNYVTEAAFQRAATEVFDAAAKLPDARFVVKPHPGDPGRVWRRLQSQFELANVEIAGHLDTYDLMRDCTVLVTMFSTTGSEAICMGKPVVSIDPDRRQGGADYLDAGAAYTVTGEGELAGILQSIFTGSAEGDPLAGARRAFAEAFFHQEERPAAERAVEFLEDLVHHRVKEPAAGE